MYFACFVLHFVIKSWLCHWLRLISCSFGHCIIHIAGINRLLIIPNTSTCMMKCRDISMLILALQKLFFFFFFKYKVIYTYNTVENIVMLTYRYWFIFIILLTDIWDWWWPYDLRGAGPVLRQSQIPLPRWEHLRSSSQGSTQKSQKCPELPVPQQSAASYSCVSPWIGLTGMEWSHLFKACLY